MSLRVPFQAVNNQWKGHPDKYNTPERTQAQYEVDLEALWDKVDKVRKRLNDRISEAEEENHLLMVPALGAVELLLRIIAECGDSDFGT
jgi:phage FluMu protein gp41